MPRMPRKPRGIRPRSSLVVSPGTEDGQNNWNDCGLLIDDILNNNATRDGATRNGITKEIIEREYIWSGPVRGLIDPSQREQNVFITYEGCRAICGAGTISWNTKQSGMNIVATWAFPLAILINLPFEHGILGTLSNWLGSPQTSLGASISNFWQTRLCYLRASNGNNLREARDRSENERRVRISAYYLLSCLNQVELGFNIAHDDPVDRDRHDEHLKELVSKIMYGLFQPLSEPISEDRRLTRALLSVLANQLRINRRRGMVPTLLGLVTFYFAVAFSMVLAFGDLSDSTSIFVLDVGNFFSWVPILVVFFLLDRNPGNSAHQATLITRWLYNVNTVRQRLRDREGNYLWWTDANARRDNAAPSCPLCADPPRVGRFNGQGRTLSYSGLVSSILTEIQQHDYPTGWDDGSLRPASVRILDRLQHLRNRPKSWFITSVACFLIVWAQILMGYAADFITPPIGPGCWSLGFFFYGCFSSVTWILQFYPLNKRRHWVVRGFLKGVSHFFNGLGVVYILLLLFVFSSGILNNCYCSSVMGGLAGWGGYVDFKSFASYLDMYDLRRWWILFSALASSISIASLAVALVWWSECRPLWADQDHRPDGLEDIDTHWLH